MKLTKEHLKTIIQEELQAVLEEARGNEEELQEGYFDFSKLADKIAGDLDGLEAELNQRIDNLGSLVRQNSAALDKMSQGEPAAMRPGLNEEDEDKWMQDLDPEHEGYCTPMTKKTCTPRRKALAIRFKKAARKKKREGGTGWQGKV
jgi:hypothetical protein